VSSMSNITASIIFIKITNVLFSMTRCRATTSHGKRCRNRCTNVLTTCYIHSGECSICLSRVGGRDDIVKLSCGHIYHQDCIYTWLDRDYRCPLCRISVRPPVVTVHDLVDAPVSDEQILGLLRRIYENGQLHTTNVVMLLDNSRLMMCSYDSGVSLGWEPYVEPHT
jgi:hypothetical protein